VYSLAGYDRVGTLLEPPLPALSGINEEEEERSGSSRREAAAVAAVPVDAVTKERVLHHHGRISALRKRQQQELLPANSSSASGGGTATGLPGGGSVEEVPAPAEDDTAAGRTKPTLSPSNSGAGGNNNQPVARTVVAALRQAFDSDGSAAAHAAGSDVGTSFDLKQLLRNVTSHSVLQQANSPAAAAVTDAGSWQAQLEQLLVHVARHADDEPGLDNLHPLFLVVLCLLMGHESPTSSSSALFQVFEKTAKRQQQDQSQHSDEEDEPSSWALQVASLLAVLPRSKRVDVLGASNAADAAEEPFSVAPEVLRYFAQAAAVYEERLEVQKARLLARLPSPRSPSKASVATTIGSAADAEAPPPKASRTISSGSSASSSSSSSNGEMPPLGSRGHDSDSSVSEEEQEEPFTQASLATALSTGADVPTSSTSVAAEVTADTSTAEGGAIPFAPPALDGQAVAAVLDAAALDATASLADRAAVAAAAQALNAAFEEVLRHAADADGEDGPENEDGGSGESDSGDEDEEDDDDDDDDESEAIEEEEEVDDVAISMSGETASPQQHEESPPAASDFVAAAIAERGDADGDEDGDEAVLRQALRMSLVTSHSSTGKQPGVDTPAQEIAASVGSSTHADSATADEEEDSNLPSFPRPPLSSQLGSLTDAASIGETGDIHGGMVESSAKMPKFLDPSDLASFGSLPATHVLMHLLRYATVVTEYQNSEARRTEGNSSLVVVGRMGAALFEPPVDEQQVRSTKNPLLKAKRQQTVQVSLQLSVATLILVLDKRDDAFENLQKAILREQQADNGDIESDFSESPHSSGEEDDPALALAMNYVEDDTPLSSEALENKGMRRKAAALAHDTAALRRTLKKRTDEWKDKVKLYSLGASYALRTLSLLLRGVVRQCRATLNGGGLTCRVSDYVGSLPSTTRLSEALSGLLCLTKYSSHLALVGGDDNILSQVFMSLDLYRDAAITWGECIPLLYPTAHMQSGLLRSLVNDCSKPRGNESSQFIQPFEAISSYPSSDMEIKVHKLQICCRRMRMDDILDSFVPRPSSFVTSTEEDDAVKDAPPPPVTTGENEPGRARHISPLISLLGSAIRNVLWAKEDLWCLHLAICHRFHTRVLLLDGLYAATDTDVDGPGSTKASPTKSLSTGDTVRVSSNPSKHLLFDSTKCSDSIAILSGFSDSSSSGGGGASVHQRASKVWGSVLSTKHYNPKSGVHRWAIRLDKCERGHVFVGVATAQASMKTYVGGDKYGWGMIGTQALWHERRKVSISCI